MKRAFDDYTRLAGSSGVRGSVWLGPDHLLVIEGRGFLFPFKEVYRRIDYTNIQAVSMATTSRYAWVGAALGLGFLLLALATVVAFVQTRWSGFTYAFGILLLLVTTWLVYHLAQGPTCRFMLQTAVLSLRIKPARRMRDGRRIMEEINAVCRRHQGEEPAPAASPTPAAPWTETQISFGEKPQWLGSKLTQATMMLLAIWGIALAGKMFWGQTVYFMSLVLTGAALFVMIIISLAQTMRHRFAGNLVGILWGSLGTLLMSGLVTYVLWIVTEIDAARFRSSPQFALDSRALERIGSFTLEGAGGFAWVAWTIIFLGGACVVLALAGYPASRPRKIIQAQETPTSLS